MVNLREYMSEEHPANRWVIIRSALVGMFCGVVMATLYYFVAALPP